MADIQVDVNDVVDAMSQEVARLCKENAILTAKLKSANIMLDGYVREAPKQTE